MEIFLYYSPSARDLIRTRILVSLHSPFCCCTETTKNMMIMKLEILIKKLTHKAEKIDNEK